MLPTIVPTLLAHMARSWLRVPTYFILNSFPADFTWSAISQKAQDFSLKGSSAVTNIVAWNCWSNFEDEVNIQNKNGMWSFTHGNFPKSLLRIAPNVF
jgi:hypothetical protein